MWARGLSSIVIVYLTLHMPELINSENEDPIQDYRERLAESDVWNSLSALKKIRWDILNDSDLDELSAQALATIVNRRIQFIVDRTLENYDQ
jgi:hypothetical protein